MTSTAVIYLSLQEPASGVGTTSSWTVLSIGTLGDAVERSVREKARDLRQRRGVGATRWWVLRGSPAAQRQGACDTMQPPECGTGAAPDNARGAPACWRRASSCGQAAQPRRLPGGSVHTPSSRHAQLAPSKMSLPLGLGLLRTEVGTEHRMHLEPADVPQVQDCDLVRSEILRTAPSLALDPANGLGA